MSRRIACLGEVMIELIPDASHSATIGVAGDTYNTAVYLARALAGTKCTVDYITCLGVDGFSDRILSHMHLNGVGTGCVERHPKKTPGLYAIETDDCGERRFTYWRSDSAARMLFSGSGSEPLKILAKFNIVLLSGISLAILSQISRNRLYDAIDRYRGNGGLIAFDSNYRPHLWEGRDTAATETQEMWQRTDIALPSVDDEMQLFQDPDESAVLRRFANYPFTKGALKRGAEGPLDLSTQSITSGSRSVINVVDTTAAGDSFNAAYLAAVVQGRSDQEAMADGHALASRVITKPGAVVELDDWPG